MKKRPFRLILALSILMLVLAACAGGGAADQGAETPAAGDTTATEAVPETGTGTEPAGSAADCAGVDTQQLMTTGQTVYADSCAGCHGEQGEGQGDFPALAGAVDITGADGATLVQEYLAVEAHPQDLTPDNLAAVLTYVRGSFGNTAAAVCPADVSIPAAQ